MSSRRRPRQNVFMSSGPGTLSQGNENYVLLFLQCPFFSSFSLFQSVSGLPLPGMISNGLNFHLKRNEFPKKVSRRTFSVQQGGGRQNSISVRFPNGVRCQSSSSLKTAKNLSISSMRQSTFVNIVKGGLHADYSICPSRRSHNKNVSKIIVLGLFLFFLKGFLLNFRWSSSQLWRSSPFTLLSRHKSRKNWF